MKRTAALALALGLAYGFIPNAAAFGLEQKGRPEATVGTLPTYGLEVPTRTALKTVIPSGWQLFVHQSVKLPATVNWKVGDPWPNVIGALAESGNLAALVDWDARTVLIRTNDIAVQERATRAEIAQAATTPLPKFATESTEALDPLVVKAAAPATTPRTESATYAVNTQPQGAAASATDGVLAPPVPEPASLALPPARQTERATSVATMEDRKAVLTATVKVEPHASLAEGESLVRVEPASSEPRQPALNVVTTLVAETDSTPEDDTRGNTVSPFAAAPAPLAATAVPQRAARVLEGMFGEASPRVPRVAQPIESTAEEAAVYALPSMPATPSAPASRVAAQIDKMQELSSAVIEPLRQPAPAQASQTIEQLNRDELASRAALSAAPGEPTPYNDVMPTATNQVFGKTTPKGDVTVSESAQLPEAGLRDETPKPLQERPAAAVLTNPPVPAVGTNQQKVSAARLQSTQNFAYRAAVALNKAQTRNVAQAIASHYGYRLVWSAPEVQMRGPVTLLANNVQQDVQLLGKALGRDEISFELDELNKYLLAFPAGTRPSIISASRREQVREPMSVMTPASKPVVDKAPELTLTLVAGEPLEVALARFLKTQGYTHEWKVAGGFEAARPMTFSGASIALVLTQILPPLGVSADVYTHDKHIVMRPGEARDK